VRYHDIVDGRRIISTEVIYEIDKRLSVAVVTLELEPEGEHTKLKLTVQLASLAGRGMVEGTRTGYAGALDNVEHFLTRDGEGGRPSR
jgi:hypothetical protein